MKAMTRIYRRAVLMLIAVIGSMTSMAQDQKFDPAKFDAEQQQFITREAKLTEKEAAQFFPLFREMQAKQRAIYERQRRLGFNKPADEKGCEQSIREHDKIDLELKQIQQTYHIKFMKVLPASKVYDVLRAEDRFFRMKLRSWGNPNRGQRQHQQYQQRQQMKKK